MKQVNVDWKFWSKQASAIKKASSGLNDIVVFLGGFRSGKSIAGSRWVIQNAMKYSNSHFLVMAVDYQKGKQTTYNVFFGENGLPGENTNPFSGGDPENSPIVEHWTKHDKNLKLVNGSVITIAGADNEERYEGGSFNGVWMDEPGNYHDKLHGVTSTISQRLDGGRPASMFWTTTGKVGSLQKFLQERKWPKTGEPVNLNIEIVKATMMNNPFLDDESKQRLRRRYEGTVNEGMALRGEFGSVEGRVYQSFSRDRHVSDKASMLKRLDDGMDRVFGYDAGWNDEMVVLHAGISNTGEVLVFDEFYESEKFIEDAISWVDDFPSGVIYSEHEPSHIKKFKSMTKHSCVKADKSIDAGVNEVRSRFNKDGIIISEECENLIEELLNYQQDDVGGTNVSDHACDALRYLCMGVSDDGQDIPMVTIGGGN